MAVLIFFISSSFGRPLSENVDERGRKLMCERTLPSLLVEYLSISIKISMIHYIIEKNYNPYIKSKEKTQFCLALLIGLDAIFFGKLSLLLCSNSPLLSNTIF